jgi:hypothetical protein
MHKSATKCNETIGKWCKNKHGASKIIDTLKTYHRASKATQHAGQEESTSVGTAPPVQPQAECLAEETGDPETITVPSLSKKRKQKGPMISLPPRTNLHSTPARQARALLIGSQ